MLPKIPVDVMTLVSPFESGNTKIHSLDNRRVYEILGLAADHDTTTVDFEGRTIVRSGNTLKITDAPGKAETKNSVTKESKTHVILRWRFATPHGVTVDGAHAAVKADANGVAAVEFDHAGTSTIAWQ